MEGKEGNNATMYMTLSFAGVALMVAMIVGMVIVKKKNGRHPHHQVSRIPDNHFQNQTTHVI